MKMLIRDITTHTLGALFLFTIVSLVMIVAVTAYRELFPEPTELSCRNSKLYEVSYNNSITIYTPTYADCEVTQ
jgi:hypothetical protein